MSTFVLVHGAFLGKFCWERLVPELARSDHKSIAMDLPIEEPEAGAERYAAAALAAITEQLSATSLEADPPILVGHSMGGMVIPLVASRIKCAALVFLAAALPKPGCSFMERARASEADVFLTEGDVNPFLNRKLAHEYWFHDCQPDVAAWAAENIRAQNSARIIFEEWPLKALPAVPMYSIVGTEERLLSPGWSRRMSRELLGVQPIEIAAGHCPQVSRPFEVAEILHNVALSTTRDINGLRSCEAR